MNTTLADGLYAGFHEPLLPFPYLVALIVITMPLAAFLGYHLGAMEFRRLGYDKVPSAQLPGGTSLGALLALLGLMLGFAFSSALGWREGRQSTLVGEAAAISTAFLTADLLEEPGRTDLQSKILLYAKTRLATADDTRNREAFSTFLSRTLQTQADLWPATKRAINQGSSDPVRVAVARSITDVLDAHTNRIAAAAEQIPPPAKLMIFVIAVIGILILGNRSALHGKPLTWRTFVFSSVLSIVIVVIFDLDRALEGTMRVNPDTLLATIDEMEKDLAARAE